MKTQNNFKLYVWKGFAPDYYGGLAFAIAESKTEAMKLVAKSYGYDPDEWGKLSIHSLVKKVAYSVGGGS